MRKICQHITLYNPGLTAFFFLLKEDEAKITCSGIINLLFGVMVDNMWDILLIMRIFPCPCGAQHVKYPHVLSTKTPNKMC